MNRHLALFGILVCAAFGWLGTIALNGAPPLKVNKDAPRLETGPPAKPTMPHSMCLDCHRIYCDDPFAIRHSKHGVACVDCHGESDAHKNDEDNLTPPEVMFPHEAINAKCRECHSNRHQALPAAVEQLRHGRLVRIERKDFACMDCHGEKHLMAVRTIQWDQKTRKLLPKTEAASPKAKP